MRQPDRLPGARLVCAGAARDAVLVVVAVVATSIPSLLLGSESTTGLTDRAIILNVVVADAMLLATVFVAAGFKRLP